MQENQGTPRDPTTRHPRPPQPVQQQDMPGRTDAMVPEPDHGERSYKGSGRLADRVALITGADSGRGRAVAIGVARGGADVLISDFEEHDGARANARWVRSDECRMRICMV